MKPSQTPFICELLLRQTCEYVSLHMRVPITLYIRVSQGPNLLAGIPKKIHGLSSVSFLIKKGQNYVPLNKNMTLCYLEGLYAM